MSLLCKWEFLIQEEVQSENLVPLPEPVKEQVGYEGIRGPMVWWSREQRHGLIVLSNSPLREEEKPYQNVGNTTIYDIDNLNEDGGRIRPPEGIIEEMSVGEGDRVFFLMHEQMRRGMGEAETTGSVYLLPEGMILRFLPSEPGSVSEGRSDFQEGLFEAPAFASDR